MPELPEVETVCRGLTKARLSAPVASVWRSSFNLRIGDYWSRAKEGSAKLKGRLPQKISRRGKYILWEFASPNPAQGPLTMVLHLGMSGAVELHTRGQKKAPHTHLQLHFEDGRRLDYVDPRRFGGFRVDDLAAHAQGPLGKLGPEPLSSDFSGEALYQALQRRRIAIRDALLHQGIVAGVGNIYAVEALFDSGVLPTRAAHSLSLSQCKDLAGAITAQLTSAIELGGTTLRDYRGPTGDKGKNQARLGVYGREGEACPTCQTPIERVVLGGRSAFYCPSCQS